MAIDLRIGRAMERVARKALAELAADPVLRSRLRREARVREERELIAEGLWAEAGRLLDRAESASSAEDIDRLLDVAEALMRRAQQIENGGD